MRHETFTDAARPIRGAAKRAQLSLLCEVRQGSGPWKLARVSDLSETGFKLGWLPEYRLDRPLRIRIPGLEPLVAQICWHKGRQIGCAFASPLHVAVFEHIVAHAAIEPGQAR